ncbi:MAG TPA: glutaminyl-peptide cyclotransferase [Flavobacterium sp.]|nr:glutaminyl-peptide cyclotransferase [Flavobacterium sp.]
MKKYKHLAFLTLTLALVACNNEKKTDFSIAVDTANMKQVYSLGESLSLQLKDTPDTTIDSVQYFVNDKKVGLVKGNDVLNYTLSSEKHGSHAIKAIAFVKGASYETTSGINIYSKIQPAFYSYTILNTYPHDIKAYTQGLEFYGDVLIESTGNGEGLGTGTKGKSSIRKVNPTTGEVMKINELDDAIFGEGTTVLNDKIYQLTYLNNEGYVYNIETLEKEQTIPYFQGMQGWGLTNDGTNLYMTDGTDRVYKINPDNFKLIDYFVVSLPNTTVRAVNELEWVNGEIYANFYGQDAIGVFSPEDGTVTGVIDLSDLKYKVTAHPDLDVLNGIAYNKKTNTFFVTGKNWDKMFEIRIDKK